MDAVAVLDLIRSRGADAVVHSGDFDYGDDPDAWDAQIDAVLGADFPYFASVGNHDESAWEGPAGYQAKLEARLRRIGIAWEGSVGVAAHIDWQGLSMVFVSPGIFQDGDTESAPYLREHFAHSECLWRVASWHKNQRLMQAGDKGDAAGWFSSVYTADQGARYGALFCMFHVRGDPRLAHCWFEDVDGNVPDELFVAAPKAGSARD